MVKVNGMLIDYHVHPDYSTDAQGTIDEYCRKALEIGLDEICFTTHYEPDPYIKDTIDGHALVKGKLVPMDSNWLDYYVADIERAKKP